jgi:16S rRNA (adenine1518-N6/adenine1519-N6)-dimethyltransferase
MLKPKKSLGQNFLRDENTLRKIAEAVAIGPTDVIVEIGPGTGALTKHLVGRCKSLTVIEIDKRAVALLTEQFGNRIRIIQEDVLKVEFSSLGSDLVVVGNIPYYITSDFLFQLFNAHRAINSATLMMQSEVAQRLTAKPRTKEYGILTVLTALYAQPQVIFKVSRNVFFPRPNVDSSVVRLEMRNALPYADELLFRNVVRIAFGQRRKTLKNALSKLGLTAEQFSDLEFDFSRRAEELALEDFIELCTLLVPLRPALTLPFAL